MPAYKRNRKARQFTTEQRQFIMNNLDDLKEAIPTKNGMIIYKLIKEHGLICVSRLRDQVEMSDRTIWSSIWQLIDYGWIDSEPKYTVSGSGHRMIEHYKLRK